MGRFWAYVGPFGGFVGPLLGHFRAMLGSVGGFRAEKKKNRRKIFSVVGFFWVGFGLMLGHLEALLGLCWAILGLCWALLAAFGLKISKYGSVEVEFWVGFGHVELVLGHLVGSMG